MRTCGSIVWVTISENPVKHFKDRGLDILLVYNLLTYLLEHWPCVTGGVAATFFAVLLKERQIAKRYEEDYDYFYEEPVFQYDQWGDTNNRPINLTQRLGQMQPQFWQNMHCYNAMNNSYNSHYYSHQQDEPYVIPRRDYSYYNENSHYNLIRQKVMYYK